MGEDNGNSGKGQIAKALERLTGSGSNINIFFLDIGPEVREEIRILKETLKDLAQANLDRTVTKQIVRDAFSMGKSEVSGPILPKPEAPKVDETILSQAERRLLTISKWSREEAEEALVLCNWDREAAAKKFHRNYAALCYGIRRHAITPPGGEWLRRKKVLRTDLPASMNEKAEVKSFG